MLVDPALTRTPTRFINLFPHWTPARVALFPQAFLGGRLQVTNCVRLSANGGCWSVDGGCHRLLHQLPALLA